VLPQRDVLAIARAAGCIPLEIREDGGAGHTDAWLSNVFVLQKN
jgi:hypothetical protein